MARNPLLLVPTPSGEPLTQPLAQQLSREDWLVFACGRYEGIDQRVMDHARTRMRVREISIGDYVLNGGEVAALVIVEAVVRLLPGFMGNPDSLAEESHGGEGLLEYPVYTKPPTWRVRTRARPPLERSSRPHSRRRSRKSGGIFKDTKTR